MTGDSATIVCLDIGLLRRILHAMPMPWKPRGECRNCGRMPARPAYVYCSNRCQIDFQYHHYIERWKKGSESGMQAIGVVSRHIKRYLREKYGDKCCSCGWSRINIHTGVVPLVADHIDGNWRNNREENLRLLCPSCDSLTSTYAGLNRGGGRRFREVSRRVIEGRLLQAKTS